MSDSMEKLRQVVADLEQELNRLPTDDATTRELLERLAADVDRALDRGEPSPLSEPSLMGNLRRSAQNFESSHPHVSGMLQQIVDILGHMGI